MNTKELFPTALQTRLVYPFFFKAHSTSEAVTALTSLTQGKKSEAAVWEVMDTVPEPYRQEFFSPAQRFLFANDKCDDCRYLRLSDNRANSWFGNKINVSVPAQTVNDFSVKIVKKTGVELFLSPFGVGILSFSLDIKLPDTDSVEDIKEYKAYNYHLAQLRRKGTMATFSLPTAPGYVAQNDTHEKKLADRLGKAGAEFQLHELCDYLLQGLASSQGNESGLALATVQQQFSVYSIAQFSTEVDFSSMKTRKALGSFLSGLAQIEEVNHAGYLSGETLDIPNHIMNTHHWAAMSFLGAAHLISDQGGIEFDNQRLSTISRKYFIPYLAAYYQRLILQRFFSDASQFVHTQSSKKDLMNESEREKLKAKQFSQLHAELLDFNVTGLFTEISSRTALNRYYHMAQDTFAISKNTDRVTQAIQSYDANKVTKELSNNVDQISKVQGSVEWFQVLFIIGASSQLTEYIGEMAGTESLYFKYSMLIAPLLSGLIALYILRPWSNDPEFKKNKLRIITIVTIVALAFIIWWGKAFQVGNNQQSAPKVDVSTTSEKSKDNLISPLASPTKPLDSSIQEKVILTPSKEQ